MCWIKVAYGVGKTLHHITHRGHSHAAIHICEPHVAGCVSVTEYFSCFRCHSSGLDKYYF
jgi:hypothetical protein